MVDDGPTITVPVNGWKVSRNIPVVMLGAMVIQLMVIGWVASKYDSRITIADERITKLSAQNEAFAIVVAGINTNIAHMQGQLEFVVQSIKQERKR
jgi:hypothetical protein